VIRRLLIANRGEIAVRIARACRELGIETVAVYSDADIDAAHVVVADRSVRIGPARVRDSYLNIAAVVGAAREAAADAVHPGYGFLSENAEFAEACSDAGLTFVGPPASVIRTMGSKIGARRLMESAGVPVVPGRTPRDQSDGGILEAVRDVGTPALVKASAGGGGRGMRTIREPGSAISDIQAARREAESAFGDGTLYVEQLIERPHHIEAQIFADRQGRVVHLFERECSVQRRHQKIIEESPSPNLTDALRQRITGAAVAAGAAATYVNAGTLEFLVDLAGGIRDDAPFYFLEMNTRLQVEHPVTEGVTGVDLVRAQLTVAAGGPLPWAQDQLTLRGHAIEARVYAEDPAHDFLPQAGQVLLYREPNVPGVRIDSGVREGDIVGVHYDPLVAKVIAAGESREVATERLLAALRGFPILGIRTNIPFLVRVLDSPEFRAGQIHTRWLDSEGTSLAAEAVEPAPSWLASVISAASDAGRTVRGEEQWLHQRGNDPWTTVRGFGLR
jgi:acetyl-CoA carboxylase biotin carboxylase subunit